MYVSIAGRVCQSMRLSPAFITLCFVLISQASYGTDSSLHLYVSQTDIGFGDLSPMNIALLAALGVVAMFLLVWFIRRSIRRKRQYSLRAERYGSSGSDSGSKLFTRSRPDKTELVRSIVIGSEGDVDVKFTNEGVSSRHAELLVLRQVDSSPLMPLEPIYYIRDMASTRGIEVMRGGDWMQFNADVVLEDEQIKLGEVEVTAAEIDRLAIETRADETATEIAQ